MTVYFLVRNARGPAWDHSKLRRQQRGWDEHADFMDALTEEGVVVLGGPVGEGDGTDAVLVLSLPDEPAVRSRLADDPWHKDGTLTIAGVEVWHVLLDGRG
jgi:uncharacterized protein YciI